MRAYLSKSLTQNTAAAQLFRFALVGVIVNAALYGIYLALTYFGMGPKTAATLTYVLGLYVNFLAHKKITFINASSARRQWAPFIVLSLLVYAVNIGGLYLLVDKVGFPHQAVQAFMIVLCAAISFVLQKTIIFKAV
ncbi:MAG: GtrA family protein [Alphaproteobacteria bacterium]